MYLFYSVFITDECPQHSQLKPTPQFATWIKNIIIKHPVITNTYYTTHCWPQKRSCRRFVAFHSLSTCSNINKSHSSSTNIIFKLQKKSQNDYTGLNTPLDGGVCSHSVIRQSSPVQSPSTLPEHHPLYLTLLLFNGPQFDILHTIADKERIRE